jgi:hypothetical protein
VNANFVSNEIDEGEPQNERHDALRISMKPLILMMDKDEDCESIGDSCGR